MPFNLLLLPLLGGLFFVRRCTGTRYYALRSDGYVLLFYGAAAGALFLFLASLLTTPIIPVLEKLSDYWDCLLAPLHCCQYIDHAWHFVAPFEHSGKALVAGLMGATTWMPLNHLFDDDAEIDKVIMGRCDPLEMSLRTALGTGKPAMLSVKSGKVYVGIVSSKPNPAFPLVSILLLPIWSGYRDDKTKTVTQTTRYPVDAYIGLADKMRKRLRDDNPNYTNEELERAVADYIDNKATRFEIVVLASELQSMSSFDQDIYQEYYHRVKEFRPFRPLHKSTAG